MKESSVNPRIICIVNQKGGVGKTTTAINLAAGLAISSQKTLLIDCDSQANATSGLGLSGQDRPNLYHVLTGAASFDDAVSGTSTENLMAIVAGTDLVGIDIEFAARKRREFIMQEVCSNLSGYDFVLLDLPPSLGLITINAMVFSHAILIPMQCEYYALEGLSQLLNTIRLVKMSFNPKLHIEGILLTMFDSRIKLNNQVAEDLRLHFEDLVFRSIIPRTIRLSESPSFGRTIFQHDPGSKAAYSYHALAQELILKHKKTPQK